MPYRTFRVDGQYCNYKIDADGNRTGEALGCFSGESEAEDQLTAIRIEEHENKSIYSSTPVNATLHVKEVNGQLRWIATYSNNIRDRDNPPEILSGESHRRAVYMTDKGVVPYPELWVWHEKAWHIGSVDWLAVDQKDGIVFALASGTVKEEAEAFMRSIADKDVALSHGMYPQSIERDEEDPTIITGYIDHEITLLPRFAAANPLTALAGSQQVKEKDVMAVNAEKRDALKKEWPEADGPLSELEALNEQVKNTAKEMDLETKEEEQADAPDEAAEEARKESEVGSEETEEVPEKDAYTAEDLRVEVVDALKALNQRLSDIEEGIEASRKNAEKEIADLREKVEASDRREKQRSEAPMSATLASLINGKSVVGKSETKVKETDEMADGPKEEKAARTGLFFEEYF